MEPAKRIIVNTSAQYIRSIVNILLSLYSTRLILGILGEIDYGIYVLVSGVVVMLSFLSNAMITTTQRYLSFHHGKKDLEKLKEVFSNSVLLHVFLGIIIVVIVEVIGFFWLDRLNIPPERIPAAKIVYHFATAMLFVTFIYSPFRALFISRENIIYISIIDVIDGILKVGVAIGLSMITFDKLVGYGAFMFGIVLFNFFAFVIFGFKRYEECIVPKISMFSKKYMKELFSFAGWSIYSAGCIVGRTQGVSVILNKFFGAAMNAPYGLSLQISGAVNFISYSLLNAMSPQIMKAEGVGDRNRMLRLSEVACKFSFLLLSLVAIPSIFEMPALLAFWLKDVPIPQYAVFICRMILLASLCDNLTIALGTANQAMGRIRNYSVIINTIKIMTLPAVIICLKCGLGIHSVMICYVIFEFICAIMRLFLLKKMAGLSILGFLKKVFFKEVIPIAVIIAICVIITYNIDTPFRFIITFFFSTIFYIFAVYFFGLCDDEKQLIMRLIKNRKSENN